MYMWATVNLCCCIRMRSNRPPPPLLFSYRHPSHPISTVLLFLHNRPPPPQKRTLAPQAVRQYTALRDYPLPPLPRPMIIFGSGPPPTPLPVFISQASIPPPSRQIFLEELFVKIFTGIKILLYVQFIWVRLGQSNFYKFKRCKHR